MVGILVSFWDGLLSGAMLVSGRVYPFWFFKARYELCKWDVTPKRNFWCREVSPLFKPENMKEKQDRREFGVIVGEIYQYVWEELRPFHKTSHVATPQLDLFTRFRCSQCKSMMYFYGGRHGFTNDTLSCMTQPVLTIGRFHVFFCHAYWAVCFQVILTSNRLDSYSITIYVDRLNLQI